MKKVIYHSFLLLCVIQLTACTGMSSNTADMVGRYKCEPKMGALPFTVTIDELADENAIAFRAKRLGDSLLILTRSGSSYQISKQDAATTLGKEHAMMLEWRPASKGNFRLFGDDLELATCRIMDDKDYNPAGEYGCQIVGGDKVEGEISRLDGGGFGFTAPFTNYAVIPLTRINQGFRSRDDNPVSLHMLDPFNESSFLIVVKGESDMRSDVVWCHKK